MRWLARRRPLGGRRKFTAAFKVLEAWAKEQPALQAPPVPRKVALAMVAALHLYGAIESSLVLLLCFVGLLRIGEALGLRVDDLVFCEIDGQPSLVLLLRQTKRGPARARRWW